MTNTGATDDGLTLEDIRAAIAALGERPDSTIVLSPYWAEWLYSNLGRAWVDNNVRWLGK